MILFTGYKTLFFSVRKIVTILGLSYVMCIKLEEKKSRGGIENRPINLIFHDR
jgi:hypothetical protein